MRATTPIILLIVFSHLLLFIPEAWGTTSFIPGHVLVKFSPLSEWSQVVVKASQTDPPDFTMFTPIISSLNSRLHARIRPAQIFSDHRVLFSVDVEHLTNFFQTKLNLHQSVVSVTAVSPVATDHMAPGPDKFRVIFVPDSKEFSATTSQNVPNSDSQPLTLLNSLKHDFQLPLLGRITKPGEAILWVDLAEFTRVLVDQLQSLIEVESAQLNYVLTYQ